MPDFLGKARIETDSYRDNEARLLIYFEKFAAGGADEDDDNIEYTGIHVQIDGLINFESRWQPPPEPTRSEQSLKSSLFCFPTARLQFLSGMIYRPRSGLRKNPKSTTSQERLCLSGKV